MAREMRTLAQAKAEICGDNPTPERLRAAEAVAELTKTLKERGWVERRWTPGPKTPLSVKTVFGWERRKLHGNWFDHPYRLVNKGKAKECFIVEPYGVYDAWEDFLRLEREGWDVSLSARSALHFPGSTIAVIIQRKRPHDHYSTTTGGSANNSPAPPASPRTA